jgi:capsular exopolysaccharide synthesis family protein
MIIDSSTPFAVVEAYRSLYSNILFTPFESKAKKLVITSAFAGEGKTTVSINLAYTIASLQPEAKVLLVDCDMRSPSIENRIQRELPHAHGLSEYLAGIDKVPFVQPTKYANLELLSSGAANDNAPALLSSSRMATLVEFFEENYNYVIIDTPPVNVVSDAVFLSEHCDGYIISTRADYSEVGAVNDLVKKLNSVEANIIGIVLNSVEQRNGKKRGYYGDRSGYGAPREKK